MTRATAIARMRSTLRHDGRRDRRSFARSFCGRTGDKLFSFNTDSRLLVRDASYSMFLKLERQYQDVLPARQAMNNQRLPSRGALDRGQVERHDR